MYNDYTVLRVIICLNTCNVYLSHNIMNHNKNSIVVPSEDISHIIHVCVWVACVDSQLEWSEREIGQFGFTFSPE